MCQVQNQNITGRYQAFSLAVTSNCQRSSREEIGQHGWQNQELRQKDEFGVHLIQPVIKGPKNLEGQEFA